jgi:hypothetical protein
MSIARTQRLIRPETSDAPFRFFEAVPWLLLAEAFRVVGAGAGTLLALLAFIFECVGVLMAFKAVARRAFPLSGFPAPLEGMPLGREMRLAMRIFWRIMALMFAVALAASCAGLSEDGPYFVWGLSGVAFNQLSFAGRMWAAVIAALVLLMLRDADRTGAPTLKSAIRGLPEHGVRFGAAIAALAIFYVGWGTLQILLFNAIWSTPALGGADARTKGLIFFGITFVFAFVRLWATLLILTSGLKQVASRRRPALLA